MLSGRDLEKSAMAARAPIGTTLNSIKGSRIGAAVLISAAVGKATAQQRFMRKRP